MNIEDKKTLSSIEENISWLRTSILNKYELDRFCSEILDEILEQIESACLTISKETIKSEDIDEMSYLDFEELDIDYIDRIGETIE